MRADQSYLFDMPPEWVDHWVGMPSFEQDDQEAAFSVKVNFRDEQDRMAFSELVGQTVSRSTRSIWYPKAEIRRYSDKRYLTDAPINPKYPVYVISKGRWESRLTSRALERINVPYSIVVEPQEQENYAAVISPAKVLVLPFSNLGQGSIPARNWVWEHAIERGAERHWILDDNIDGFFRLNDNLKVEVESGATFRAIEDFTDRYENVGMSGMNYFMFASRKSVVPPFVLNTRIYSCILIRNDLPFRWRGRYNEDTDLSLRVLKAGWCTILFNAFLANKTTTMTMKGGNTDQLYQGDGRLEMARSLYEQHPDVVKITYKWGRAQHSVNYKGFRRNKLKLKPGLEISKDVDEFGMDLRRIE